MRDPKELLYSKSHEWIEIHDDGSCYIGLTDYAQKELGDIVFINLPEEGEELTTGESFADVESVKAVSDVFSPVNGIVAEVNEELLDAPELINNDPFEAWLVRLEEVEDQPDLISYGEYEDYIESLD